MGRVAPALVQHLSSELSTGDQMRYSQREHWHDCLNQKAPKPLQIKLTGREYREKYISLRNKLKSEESEISRVISISSYWLESTAVPTGTYEV